MYQRIIFALLILAVTFSGCFEMENEFNQLAPGKWRAVLNLDKVPNAPLNKKAEPMEIQDESKISGGILPFNFEVKYTNDTTFQVHIINGEERIVVEDVAFGRNIETGDDTVRVNFPHYDSYITGIFEENVFEGYWVVESKKDYAIPFLATQGKSHRFTQLRKEPMDVNGQWKVTFGTDTENPYPAIGEFKQDGNHLEGTFRTETGDYRFLEGTVQGDKMYLSVFDGSHAFLFEAKMMENGELVGTFRSGSHYTTMWKGVRDENARLTDPDSLTQLVNEEGKLNFSFANEAGEMVSLSDERYAGKPVLVQVLGTWCPNCADETAYLAAYKKKHENLPFEIIGLAFERYDSKEKVWKVINRFKNRFDVDYEVLWAGKASKKAAAEALPDLDRIVSFPTLIFIDKKGKVRKIHTGFNGPATSKFGRFEREFEEMLETMLRE